MIINKETLLKLAPIENMYSHKMTHVDTNTTWGLSACGYDIRLKQTIRLAPKEFCLGSSLEKFQMPNSLLGVVHDKSSNIRKGISVFNSVIDSGWEGYLTLELYNHSENHLLLPSGMGIAHILFHQVLHPTKYTGAYQNQPDKPITGKHEMKTTQEQGRNHD